MKKLLLLLLLSACVTRQQVEAELWMNDGIPKYICDQKPELYNFGIYRVVPCRPEVLDCQHGEPSYQEYLPYCSNRIKEFMSADRRNVIDWLAQLTRPR